MQLTPLFIRSGLYILDFLNLLGLLVIYALSHLCISILQDIYKYIVSIRLRQFFSINLFATPNTYSKRKISHLENQNLWKKTLKTINYR